jgi:hypothetical protein
MIFSFLMNKKKIRANPLLYGFIPGLPDLPGPIKTIPKRARGSVPVFLPLRTP